MGKRTEVTRMKQAATRPSAGRWKLEGAKALFSELVRHAREEGPRRASVRGHDAVVVMSVEEFERLAADKPRLPFLQFMEGLHLESPSLEREVDRGQTLTCEGLAARYQCRGRADQSAGCAVGEALGRRPRRDEARRASISASWRWENTTRAFTTCPMTIRTGHATWRRAMRLRNCSATVCFARERGRSALGPDFRRGETRKPPCTSSDRHAARGNGHGARSLSGHAEREGYQAVWRRSIRSLK